jgi:4-aminobutyrate aminotransferase/(S)-3-amino-2-methylpropionate transaminase
MQNSGGYIVPPVGFLRDLQALCKESGLLLVADELFTGFGRNGYWLSMDREGIAADIVLVGKGMTGGIPSAACVASHDIMESLVHPGIIPLHGSTFVGNPIACASITATIDVLRSERLIERAKQLGQTLIPRISERSQRYSCVGDVRGLGAAIAVEFVKSRTGKERDDSIAWAVNDALMAKGIITLVTGLPYCNVLAICPPLVISEEQCDFLVESLFSTIESIQRERQDN